MDLRKIKKLIELLNESGVGEIEITEGEDSVRISRESSAKKMVTKDEENTANSKEIISTESSNNQNQSESTKPCLLYTSPRPRDGLLSRMPSTA